MLTLAISSGCITDRVLQTTDGAVVVNEPVVERARRTTEQRRGLPFVREVPLEVLTSDELAVWLNRYYDQYVTALERRDRFFHKLGILPPTRDTASTYKGVIGNFAGGIYDDDRVGADGQRGTMILVSDYAWWSKVQLDLFGLITGVDQAYEMFLVHELTHALQDQHLHLDRLIDDADDDDARMVQKTILESEAGVVGMAHLLGLDLDAVVPRTALLWFMRYNNLFNGPVVAAAAGKSSSFFARQTFSQYELGLSFVEERLLAGELSGGALAELSRSYARVPGSANGLPESTEQLLFAHKRGEHPDRPLHLAPLSSSSAFAEHTVVDSGVFGALALKHWLDGPLGFGAEPVVDGWGGDRYEVLVDTSNHTVVVWRLLGDTEADTVELFNAIRDRLRQAWTKSDHARLSTTNDTVNETAARFIATAHAAPEERRALRTDREEWFALERRGRALVVVNGLDAARDLEPWLAALHDETTIAPPAAHDDTARSETAAALERTLASPQAQRSAPPVAEQLFLPARTIAVRVGAELTTRPNSDLRPLALDGEARWGVRPFLELALPFTATVHGAFGPFHVGVAVAPLAWAPLAPTTEPWSARLSSTIVGGDHHAALVGQLEATPRVQGSVVESTDALRIGAVLRPLPWLTLQPGVEVARGAIVDSLGLGGVLVRGATQVPLVEVEVLRGLRLWGSTQARFSVRDIGTSAMTTTALLEQRFSAGVLFLL